MSSENSCISVSVKAMQELLSMTHSSLTTHGGIKDIEQDPTLIQIDERKTLEKVLPLVSDYTCIQLVLQVFCPSMLRTNVGEAKEG